MSLNINRMNDNLVAEWLDKHTTLSVLEKNIFVDIKKMIQSDLSLFYDMNRIHGDVSLNAQEFRKIITTFIEIYEPIYPMGTVVELKKEAFKGLVSLEEKDRLLAVIAHRYVPINENRYIPYVGIRYPFGATKELNNGLHFTSAAVKKIIHNGYTDEQEIAYIFNLKKKAIIELNMHSTAFLTAEEYIRINNNNKVTN